MYKIKISKFKIGIYFSLFLFFLQISNHVFAFTYTIPNLFDLDSKKNIISAYSTYFTRLHKILNNQFPETKYNEEENDVRGIFIGSYHGFHIANTRHPFKIYIFGAHSDPTGSKFIVDQSQEVDEDMQYHFENGQTIFANFLYKPKKKFKDFRYTWGFDVISRVDSFVLTGNWLQNEDKIIHNLKRKDDFLNIFIGITRKMMLENSFFFSAFISFKNLNSVFVEGVNENSINGESLQDSAVGFLGSEYSLDLSFGYRLLLFQNKLSIDCVTKVENFSRSSKIPIILGNQSLYDRDISTQQILLEEYKTISSKESKDNIESFGVDFTPGVNLTYDFINNNSWLMSIFCSTNFLLSFAKEIDLKKLFPEQNHRKKTKSDNTVMTSLKTNVFQGITAGLAVSATYQKFLCMKFGTNYSYAHEKGHRKHLLSPFLNLGIMF